MKRIPLFIILPAAVYFLVTAFTTPGKYVVNTAMKGDELVIPEDVTAILDKSCFGCHNSDSKADKAKKKLLIDQINTLSPAKLVGKLGDISDVLKENEMPPEKFLEKYPDKKLTEDESRRLREWADTTIDALLK